jgi:hypothetical protein
MLAPLPKGVIMSRLLTALLLALVYSNAGALDMDGIKIGDAWSPAKFQKPYGDKGVNLVCDQMRCMAEMPTPAGNISILILSEGGRVLEIAYLFPSAMYDAILKNLKWGPPTHSSQSLKTNEFGTQVNNRIAEWKDDRQVATLEQYENPTTGMLSLKAPPKPY